MVADARISHVELSTLALGCISGVSLEPAGAAGFISQVELANDIAPASGFIGFTRVERVDVAASGFIGGVSLEATQASGFISGVVLEPAGALGFIGGVSLEFVGTPVVEVVPPVGMGGVFHAEKLTREYAEKSWDLLEAKLLNQAIDSAFKVEVPSPLGGSKEFHSLVDSKESNTTVDHAHQAQTAIKFISNNASSDSLALIRRRREDEEAFLLILLA